MAGIPPKLSNDAARWKQVYLAAQRLLEMPAAHRDAFAQREYGAEPELLAAILDLVKQSDEPDADTANFLDFSPTGAAPPARPGRRLGPWRIIRELGRGGMGQVLLAERDDGHFSKQVAIKLVNGFAVGELRERILRERQILANLDHPGIARLLDGGETEDGSPYLVMEYVEGTSLDVWREAEKPTLEVRLRLFCEICLALEFAHRNMVVHRDLKPSNILVTPEGQPRLLDFGIAKMLEAREIVGELTVAGSGQMSLAYASPEQVNSQPVTTSTDVYSLGVVLYELLTGVLPYRVKGLSLLEAVRVICSRQAAPASVGLPEARGDLDAILAKALEKDPAQRYASVQDFRRDIANYLGGHPVYARPATWVYRALKFLRRNTWQVVAAVVIVTVVATGGTVTWLQKRRADQRTAEVRDLANRMLSGYLTRLSDLPGSAPLRQQMANDASQFLDRLAGEAPASEELAREVASAYRLLSLAQAGARSSIGDFSGGLRSIGRALAIREELLRRKPGDPERQLEVARALLDQTILFMHTFDPRVDAATERMVALLDALPAQWRDRTQVQELLASALGQRSWAHGFLRRPREEVAIELRRLGIRERLAAAAPASLTAQMNRADAHLRYSVALFDLRDAAASVVEARRSVELLQATAPLARMASPSEQIRYRFMLAAAAKGVGKPELSRGNYLAAGSALAESAQGCQSLFREDASNLQAENCLAEALVWQARALQLAGSAAAGDIVRHYLDVALTAFAATRAGEDAYPFDVELLEQAALWQLPLSSAGERRLRSMLASKDAQTENGHMWLRRDVAGLEWLADAAGRRHDSAAALSLRTRAYGSSQRVLTLHGQAAARGIILAAPLLLALEQGAPRERSCPLFAEAAAGFRTLLSAQYVAPEEQPLRDLAEKGLAQSPCR